jgi:hypothetical protein
MQQSTITTGDTSGMTSSTDGSMSAQMESCIDACTSCHRVCLATVRASLGMGGEPAADHVRMLIDCAQICATSADFMIRGSELHHVTCDACADICEACAESCRALGGVDMEACADVCDTCAEACGAMADAAAGEP